MSNIIDNLFKNLKSSNVNPDDYLKVTVKLDDTFSVIKEALKRKTLHKAFLDVVVENRNIQRRIGTPKNSIDMALCLVDIGDIYATYNDLKETKKLYRKALTIFTRKFGKTDPYVVKLKTEIEQF